MQASDTPAIQALLAEVQAGQPHPIEVVVQGPASGQLRHSQSQEERLPNGALKVTVQDVTDVDYTLSHELMHIALGTRGYPRVQFQLLTGTPELDKQHYATATALATAVDHAVIAQWQREAGLLGAKQAALLEAGFEDVLPREVEAGDNMLIYRALVLLDHLVLLAGGTAAQQAQWQAQWPEALAVAQALYQTLTTAPDTPLAYRRAVVHLFGQFNALIQAHGYAPIANNEFVTLPPVLSKRQLRLSLKQLYHLKHSAYYDRDTKQSAYVALGQGDDQNAFVLPLKDTSSAAFQRLYQQPMAAVLATYQLDYTVR